MKILMIGPCAEHAQTVLSWLAEAEQEVVSHVVACSKSALRCAGEHLGHDVIIAFDDTMPIVQFPSFLNTFKGFRERPKLVLILREDLPVIMPAQDPTLGLERSGVDLVLYFQRRLRDCLLATLARLVHQPYSYQRVRPVSDSERTIREMLRLRREAISLDHPLIKKHGGVLENVQKQLWACILQSPNHLASRELLAELFGHYLTADTHFYAMRKILRSHAPEIAEMLNRLDTGLFFGLPPKTKRI